MAIVTSRAGRAAAAPVPIVALDFSTVDQAMELVDELGELCRFYKVGSELFTAEGPSAVRRLRERGCEVMLDLKLHDIPNTVRGAVYSARGIGARIITVHAAGGGVMIRAAVEEAGDELQVFAVTILTSLDAGTASEVWGRSEFRITDEVVRLARLAEASGARGVVASGSELLAIRSEVGLSLEVLVPGVRSAGTAAGDQARVVTPGEAARAGANYVILGRAVTRAVNPRTVILGIADELRRGTGGVPVLG